MDKETAVSSLTDVMAKFTAYIGKRLPKDVKEKTAKLRAAETQPAGHRRVRLDGRQPGVRRQAQPAQLPGYRRDPVLRLGRGALPAAG